MSGFFVVDVEPGHAWVRVVAYGNSLRKVVVGLLRVAVVETFVEVA